MRIKIRYVIAFLLLMLLIQEVHEIAHLLADILVGGCGGTRYLLFWDLCEAAPTAKVAITALAGPFTTYLFMWIGFVMLGKNSSPVQKSWGFTFIMAAVPLWRMQSIILRGGDELLAVRKIMGPNQPFKGAAVIIGSLLILLVTLPPLWRAFKNMQRANRILWFTAFLILPYIATMELQKIFLSPAMKTILLSTPLPWANLTWLILIDAGLLLFFMLTYKNISSGKVSDLLAKS